MNKTTLLSLASGCLLGLASPSALAQESNGIVKIPISADAVVIDSTEDEEAAEAEALAEATKTYQAAPQSVKNFCIYYISSFYGCMGQTVLAQNIEAVEHPLFDIYVDQIIYSNIPVEIIVAMPTEYQQYFIALKSVWDKAAEQANALAEGSSEADYQSILDAAYTAETQLSEKYATAAEFMESIIPYLSEILMTEAQVESKLAQAELDGDYSDDKENYAKVLDVMSDSIYALIKN